MCMECFKRGVGTERVPFTLDMARTARYIRAWYQLPGNGVGGALHISTDDHNLEDHHLDFCAERLAEDQGHGRVPVGVDVGWAVLTNLRAMTEPQREATVWASGCRDDYNLDLILQDRDAFQVFLYDDGVVLGITTEAGEQYQRRWQ